MNIISNRDLSFGGMPAVNRALNSLAAHISDLRNQQELLEIADAQRVQRIASLETQFIALAERINTLEIVLTEELLDRTPSASATEPADPYPSAASNGIIADSWLDTSWVTDYTAALNEVRS